MRARVAAAAALALLAATPASAHRLDEYLQATTLAVEKGRIQAEISLSPGVAVFPVVFAGIDADADGIVSAAEERTYAERVMRDLALSVDGTRLPLRRVSSTFSTVEALREGRGGMRIAFESDVPPGGVSRVLTFENHHQRAIGAYLVNGLVPRDPAIRIEAQNRSYEQSFYQLDYSDAAAPSGVLSLTSWSGLWKWLGSAAIVLIAGVGLLRGRDRAGWRRSTATRGLSARRAARNSARPARGPGAPCPPT